MQSLLLSPLLCRVALRISSGRAKRPLPSATLMSCPEKKTPSDTVAPIPNLCAAPGRTTPHGKAHWGTPIRHGNHTG